ncbi:MAG: rhodanese-like domain-containing protein [Desulfobacteraceae bacterium]
MKSKILVYTIAAILILGTGIAFAYENITAKEAYDMVNNGEAILIDVRTLEECLWVGMPDVANGWLYVIPWLTKTISADGTVVTQLNPDFEALVLQEFGGNFNQVLITMCRSGGRSTSAANLLEGIGFTNVYEIDNALKEAENGTGGRGGFQGTSYGSDYDGYRGYPARLPNNQNPNEVTVQTRTDRIRNPESSVSWMDTGLPITQDLSKAVIPVLSD